jgi:peptidylprolyl isomerase/peptidyl-prolyl cis-trans isomerase B (cyclophilin B)
MKTLALGFMFLFASSAMAQVPADIKLEKPEHQLVKLTTDAGDIYLEMFPEDAPKHVENFVTLIEKGFYNGLTFHRIVPGFVIQGGCPKGTGTGDPGYKVKAEFNKRQHLKGTLAMARSSDPDSAGCQFYICLEPQPGLDNQYTVFGQVVKGHDVPAKVKMGDKMKLEILKK